MGRGWGRILVRGRPERRRRGRSQGGKVPAWTFEGFDPLEGISKYITFKGSKGRDLLKRRIFNFFIKPVRGFYKKDKKLFFKKRPREEGLGGKGKEGRGKKDWQGQGGLKGG